MYNFNPSNNYDVEWDNLNSHLKKYVNFFETNVLDNLFSNEMVDDASNPNKKILLTYAENIEPFNISYENLLRSNNKRQNFLTHNVSKRTDEFMACKEFHFHMRQLNNGFGVVDPIESKVLGQRSAQFFFFLTIP